MCNTSRRKPYQMKQEINFLFEVNLPPQGRTISRYPEVQRE